MFLRNIRRLIRDSVKKLELPSNKTSLSRESVDSIGFSSNSREELNEQDKADLELICKMDLNELKSKQHKLGYFNSITLMQYLVDNPYEDEDKSCSSEKI